MAETENINKIVLKKLTVGGIIISILTGVFVFFVESTRVNDHVEKLAVEESMKCSRYYSDFYHTPCNESLSTLKNALKTSLDKNLFILIEIYDDNLNRIIIESLKGIDKLRNDLDKRFTGFIMKGKTAIKITSLNREIYIKVMSPIRDEKNKIIGHLEGVYHVNRKKVVEIKNQIFWSVFQSIIIVLLTTILLYPIILKLHKKLFIRSCDLLDSNINTIKSLGNAIAKRDSDTHAHNYRVTVYSVRLAEQAGLKKEHIKSLIKGAFLHDVGKIGISDNILLKPGKLTKEEFEIMKKHVVLGKEIIKDNKWLNDATDVVLYHHEKFDGSGYPHGLQGQEIPITARIFAIIDVFDALTADRPYKKAFSLEKSLEILKKGKGSHFDPEFMTIFEQMAVKLHREVSTLEKKHGLFELLEKLINKYFTL